MHSSSSNSTLSGYDRGAIFLHWLIALLIIALLVMGFVMQRTPLLDDATRFTVYQWHKTLGILVLGLTLARISWRLFNPAPPHFPMNRMEHMAATAVTWLFYAVMLLVPLSGWIMVSASETGIPTLLFLSSALNWAHLPVPQSAALEHLAENAHIILAYSFVVLLFLHIGGAMKHVVIDRMPEMARILPSSKVQRKSPSPLGVFVSIAIAVIFFVLGLWVGREPAPRPSVINTTQSEAVTQDNANWNIDMERSSLTYVMDFSGKPINGAIKVWTADIRFDPENLADAHADMTIEASSISYENDFVGRSIGGPDGLQYKQFPIIKVVVDRFEKRDTDWVGFGTVTIRDTSVPVELPFTFSETSDGEAHVQGHAQLDRLAFGMGAKNDPSGKWIGLPINVNFEFFATRNQ